jgi:hypothetical protein
MENIARYAARYVQNIGPWRSGGRYTLFVARTTLQQLTIADPNIEPASTSALAVAQMI